MIVETVFYLPGFGRLLLDGVSQRDLPLATGVLVVLVVLMAGASLVIRVATSFADPVARARRPA
jgi:ABC-type dipeptide/oligopeptide/nickel transport system permease component